VILGTAGHIDHGKTTLVRALTGVDTDRLPEEKKRGITIELGFAPLRLEGVGTIGIVDVPGHEAFVRTMLAGATGIDLALVVIAADEGLMPQTREHLAILGLLGVSAGVIALTKCDLAESDWMQLVEDDTRAALAGGPLATAPIVRCSATTGAGIDELRSALADAARSVPSRAADDLFRMPIDRAFSVKGTGTVVTGTVWSGSLDTEEQVAVRPGDLVARVRGIESHGASLGTATSGTRAAVALAGVDRAAVPPRGAMLVKADDPWTASTLLRADVALLDGAPTLGPRTRVRLHIGTAEVGARVVAVGGPVIPGAHVPARLSLDAPVVARAGDRFVLRSASPAGTIGGGMVTDPAPAGRRVRPWASLAATPAERLLWLVTDAGGRGLVAGSLPVRLGLKPGEAAALIAKTRQVVRVDDRLYSRELAETVKTRIRSAVAAFHRSSPLADGAPMEALRVGAGVAQSLTEHALRELVKAEKLVVRGGVVAQPGWSAGGSEADRERTASVLAVIQAAGGQPPSVDELSVRFGHGTLPALKLLARTGDVVAVTTDRYFAAAALAALVAKVQSHLAGGVEATASELREVTGLTRKYLIPFLEYCDRAGITVRRGDIRLLPGGR
jgi:selenocysteine-specific elongation factor